MKKYFYNSGYFLKEVKKIIGINLLSNIATFFSIALILFILTMVISGWWISGDVIKAIQGEAEISVYYNEGSDTEILIKSIKSVDGVYEALLVNESEAYERMEGILGKEAKVLEYFDDNPFSSFIEVKIDLNKINSVLSELKLTDGIEHIRDNQDVLTRLRNISEIFNFLGSLVISAAGITTLVIVFHIIKLGIYSNKEQINTLRLLGATEGFIGFPFILEGLFITLVGGLIAISLAGFILRHIYAQIAGPLPFIPLPALTGLLGKLRILIMTVSGVLGLMGSLSGLFSTRRG
ncbi:MAG: hypothetical protein GX154_08705 [Clostridiales bacterium]|nr:hypothetical protein [Clostridiales bacterium]